MFAESSFMFVIDYFSHNGKISHACHGPRRVGLAAFAAHGHTGTWAHGQGKEVAFIHEDKDASDEWGVAQIYKLPRRLSYVILFHPKYFL